MGVGFIGVGMISDTYLENLSSFPDVRVVILGDIDTDRAKAQADKYDIPSHGTADDVLAHPDVQIVVNLTVPAVHAEISSRAIAAGKHVWTEKPIGLDRDSTSALLRQAEQAGLRVGVAPDTVLGPGVQTAKRAIEDGVIGTPLFASTSMQWQGPDLIHPNPAFLFAQGAGPLLDMGPYYFTALVNIFGPVRAVAALGLKGREERTVQAGPDAGATFPVEVPSTMQVLTAFRAGQQAQSLLSFDSPLFRHGVVEVSGTDGTLVLPDPNTFGGRIAYVAPLDKAPESLADLTAEQQWIEIEQRGTVTGRGLGVLEMARAIHEGRDHRANGAVGYHVLDIMLAAEESALRGEFVTLDSTIEPVPAMPLDFDPFARTLTGPTAT